jgi:hypothetical protein
MTKRLTDKSVMHQIKMTLDASTYAELASRHAARMANVEPRRLQDGPVLGR